MHSPRRGEIYLLEKDVVGKQRPVVVVSINQLNGGNSCLVIPFSTQKIDTRSVHNNFVCFEQHEFGLKAACVAKVSDLGVMLISNLQKKPIGTVSVERMQEIEAAMKWVLGIP